MNLLGSQLTNVYDETMSYDCLFHRLVSKFASNFAETDAIANNL